jgi:hypothetical protein
MPTLHRKTYSPGEDRGLHIWCLVRPLLANKPAIRTGASRRELRPFRAMLCRVVRR